MLPVTQLIKDIQETGKGNYWIYKIAAFLENTPEGSWLLKDDGLRVNFIIHNKDGYVSINGGEIKHRDNFTAEYIIKEAMNLYTKYFYEVYERCKKENIRLMSPFGHFVTIEAVAKKNKMRAIIEDKIVNVSSIDTVLRFLHEENERLKKDSEYHLTRVQDTRRDFSIMNKFFSNFMHPFGDNYDMMPNFIERVPVIHGERNVDDKFIINGKTYGESDVRMTRNTPKEDRDKFTLESIFTETQSIIIRELINGREVDELYTPLTQAEFILKYKNPTDGTEGVFSTGKRLPLFAQWEECF